MQASRQTEKATLVNTTGRHLMDGGADMDDRLIL